jgi:hypothetical protein
MARDFSKNTSNYISCTAGTFGNALHGASKYSIHVIATADTLTGVSANDNRLLHTAINGTTTGLLVNVDAGSGGLSEFRITAVSQAADTGQTVISASGVSTGTEYALGGMVDIGGDTMSVYFNGALETGPTGVTFGAATYTQGTPSVTDTIGGPFGTPSNSNSQWDGRIAELAIWTDDIGAAGFAALNKRVSATRIRPDALVAYYRMVEDAVIDIVGGTVATINGTVAKAAHPRIAYSGWPYVAMTGSGGGGGDPYDQGAQTSLGSFNQMIFRRAWR